MVEQQHSICVRLKTTSTDLRLEVEHDPLVAEADAEILKAPVYAASLRHTRRAHRRMQRRRDRSTPTSRLRGASRADHRRASTNTRLRRSAPPRRPRRRAVGHGVALRRSGEVAGARRGRGARARASRPAREGRRKRPLRQRVIHCARLQRSSAAPSWCLSFLLAEQHDLRPVLPLEQKSRLGGPRAGARSRCARPRTAAARVPVRVALEPRRAAKAPLRAQPSGKASARAAAQVPYRSMTVEGGGQSPSRSRLSASPPRRRACVRDQSVDDGGLPYSCRQARIANRTHSRVRVGAIASGWQRLQYS